MKNEQTWLNRLQTVKSRLLAIDFSVDYEYIIFKKNLYNIFVFGVHLAPSDYKKSIIFFHYRTILLFKNSKLYWNLWLF